MVKKDLTDRQTGIIIYGVKTFEEVQAMLLEIRYLEDFVEKCQRMMKAYPEEAYEKLPDAIREIVYAVFFAGYIRGRDPDFDYNRVLTWIFGAFSTDEWKEFEGEVIYADEDYFRKLSSDAFEIAENLYRVVKRLLAEEPVKGPIGRVVFEVREEEEDRQV